MTEWRKQDIFKVSLITILMLAFLGMFLPFYAETLLAAVFALAIEPALGRWLQLKHLRLKASVAGILVMMFVLVAGPISIVAYKFYLFLSGITQTGFQNTEMFQKLVLFRAQLLKFANKVLHTMSLENKIDLGGLSEEALNKIGTFMVAASTDFVYKIPDALISIFVFCVALYFFLAEARMLKTGFLRMKLLTQSEAEKLITVMQKASYNTVVTSIILGLLAAVMVALGAVFLDAGDFTVVFVITFFCSFVPVIGAGPVAFALGIYKLVMGAYGDAIGLVILSGVVGLTDNIVRPFLISSGEDDLHPAVGLLALLGALMIFGMPGLFLGPVIAIIAINVLDIFYPESSPTSGSVKAKK